MPAEQVVSDLAAIATYRPINMLKLVAHDVWLVGGPVVPFGPPFLNALSDADDRHSLGQRRALHSFADRPRWCPEGAGAGIGVGVFEFHHPPLFLIVRMRSRKAGLPRVSADDVAIRPARLASLMAPLRRGQSEFSGECAPAATARGGPLR